MEQIIELAIGESPSTRYVEQQLDDGRVVLRPQTELERMHQNLGSRPLTSDEFDELVAPYIGPPDGEGQSDATAAQERHHAIATA